MRYILAVSGTKAGISRRADGTDKSVLQSGSIGVGIAAASGCIVRCAGGSEPLFDKELDYFIAHQHELVASYSGKILVLRGEEVIGAYASPLEAYNAAMELFPVGTFMLQPCEPGPDAYTVIINSLNRVSDLIPDGPRA